MDIRYSPDTGLVIGICINEPKTLLATIEALIETFKEDCDVSSLEKVLEVARLDLIHTTQ